MKRLTLALYLLGASCAALPLSEVASAATATVKTTLSSTVWTDLGVGPLLLNAGGTQVVYAVSDTTPALSGLQGFALPVDLNETVNTASHVWAKGATPNASFVYVSPILAGGSGGSGGTFTWPGSAALTNYGTAPTGTVPAVNSFCTNCSAGGSGGVPPFTSAGAFSTPMTATTTSATMTFPAGTVTGSVIKVYNRGPNPVYWTYGAAPVATTAMAQLAPYSWDSFVVKAGDLSLAAITSITGQTATLNMELGSGAPNGTGGPINQAVAAAGSTATFYEVIAGLDNTNMARSAQATAPGTAAANFLIGIQGAPGGVPVPMAGAMTVANGADVTQGAIADTAWSGSGSGTVVAILKALVGGVNAGYDAALQATRIVPTSNVPPGSCSVTITAANTAQNLPNLGTANVHGFHIVNKDATTGSGEAIGVNFTSTAAMTGSIDTVLLAPPPTTKDTGGSFTTSTGEGLNHAVSVIAPTAGHVVYCMWY